MHCTLEEQSEGVSTQHRLWWMNPKAASYFNISRNPRIEFHDNSVWKSLCPVLSNSFLRFFLIIGHKTNNSTMFTKQGFLWKENCLKTKPLQKLVGMLPEDKLTVWTACGRTYLTGIPIQILNCSHVPERRT